MLSCNVIRQPYYLDSELAFIAMEWKSCIVFFALGLNMRILNREGTAEVGMGISFMLGVGIIKLTTASCITVHTPRLPPKVIFQALVQSLPHMVMLLQMFK